MQVHCKKHGTTEQSQKTNLASIASSCAMMSAYYTAEKQRKAEEALAQSHQLIKQKAFEGQFVDALDKLR